MPRGTWPIVDPPSPLTGWKGAGSQRAGIKRRRGLYQRDFRAARFGPRALGRRIPQSFSSVVGPVPATDRSLPSTGWRLAQGESHGVRPVVSGGVHRRR